MTTGLRSQAWLSPQLPTCLLAWQLACSVGPGVTLVSLVTGSLPREAVLALRKGCLQLTTGPCGRNDITGEERSENWGCVAGYSSVVFYLKTRWNVHVRPRSGARAATGPSVSGSGRPLPEHWGPGVPLWTAGWQGPPFPAYAGGASRTVV